MILAFNLADIVQVPFGWLLSFLYEFTTNYGVALIIFAAIVKLVLLPATAKGKKSSMKMSRLSPRIEAIKNKYPNDQQKQSEEIQALYKEEGVSVGGGCLWSFLPILVLIPLYAVVRQPITYMLNEGAEAVAKILEIIKAGSPESFTGNTYYEQMVGAKLIPSFVDAIKEALPEISAKTLEGINFNFLGIDLAATPQWKVWSWEITAEKNLWYYLGGVLMPLLSAGGQLVSMLISQKMNNSLVTDDKGLQDKETAKNSQANQSMQTMMWVGPIMSLWIGFSMPAALSLYWFAQGIVTTISDAYLTAKYRKIYDAEDAQRLQKYLAEQKVEEEKERVRAERRAANPEGITQNTSKKKVQQAKQAAREADRAAAARAYAEQKGEPIPEEPKKENAPLSGIADRPFAKGRAYDPNRYSRENTEE